jgi:hypothetical protein
LFRKKCYYNLEITERIQMGSTRLQENE